VPKASGSRERELLRKRKPSTTWFALVKSLDGTLLILSSKDRTQSSSLNYSN
jgi:hypothetical protein